MIVKQHVKMILNLACIRRTPVLYLGRGAENRPLNN